MFRQETMNDVTLEQFAAFLDGNLSNDDTQTVSDAIDTNKDYSSILSDIMEINDTVDMYSAQQDSLLSEMPGFDYDLPVLPVSLNSQDSVDLAPVDSAEPVLVNVQDEDVSLCMATEELDVQDEANNYRCPEIHLLSSDEDYTIESLQEETIDFNEMA